jgi:hypothetical protein
MVGALWLSVNAGDGEARYLVATLHRGKVKLGGCGSGGLFGVAIHKGQLIE